MGKIIEKMLTTKDVAAILQLSTHTIRRAIKDGKLKGYRVGRAWRFKEKDIEEWINQ